MAKVSRGGKYIGTSSSEEKHFYVPQKNGPDIRVKADSIAQANALFKDTRDKTERTYRDPSEVKEKKK